MPTLLERQLWLQQAILAEPPRYPDDRPGRGVRTYRHAYRARLAGALRQGYPRLAASLGRDRFRRLAERYARATPSRHFSIRWHGGALATFLRGAHADLARMEWALGLAFDATDAAAVTAAELEGMGAEVLMDLPLRLHSTAHVLTLSHSVAPWWESLGAGAGDAPSRIPGRPHALIVWRQQLEVKWRTAAIAEADALVALHDAGSLAGACRGLPAESLDSIGTWLGRWIVEGLLASPGCAAP